MRFGLLGYPIAHSLSPSIYKQLLGDNLSYDLLEFLDPAKIPTLQELALNYNGINITAPYKNYFSQNVEYEIEAFSELGIINTLSFVEGAVIATNTDYSAVEFVLQRYQLNNPYLKIILLGSGGMARITEIIASALDIPLVQLSRSLGLNLAQLDLTKYQEQNTQSLVINACSRDFVFQGKLSKDMLFWDYNYSYLSDPTVISLQVKDYQDGQELLRLQAEAAVEFWRRTNPKLK